MTTSTTRARRGPRTNLAQLIGDRLAAPVVEPGAMPSTCQAPCNPPCKRDHYAFVPLLEGKRVEEEKGGKRTGLCYSHYSKVRRGGDARDPVVALDKRPEMEKVAFYLPAAHKKAAEELAGAEGDFSDVLRAAVSNFLARPVAEQRELLAQHLGHAPAPKKGSRHG